MRISLLENPAVNDAAQDDVAALARQYGPTVFRAAWRILGSRAAAEDVQQQLFLRLIESPPRGVQSWPAWLTASATRLAIDLRRMDETLAALRGELAALQQHLDNARTAA